MNHSFLPQLAEAVAGEFVGRAVGHCARVDGLDAEEARALCQLLRARPEVGFRPCILSPSPQSGDEIRPDQAIEARNRKDRSICLIVPVALRDDVPDSLANALADFDLGQFLKNYQDKLHLGLPEPLRNLVRKIQKYLGGRAAVSTEDLIAYLQELDEDPTEAAAGRSLWRVGLVPDFGADLVSRLGRNRHCVDGIARPSRPQSSPMERLERAGLSPGEFRDRLTRYLSGRLLHRTEKWQRPLALDPAYRDLSFDQWPFPEQPVSELEAIDVESFVDQEGCVKPYCKLTQPPEGPGRSLIASVGPKSKVTVRWTTTPSSPAGVAHWRAEMIPSRREYGEEAAAELPSSVVKASGKETKSAHVSLDIDLEETELRAVEIKITALGSDGSEIRGSDSATIVGYSDEFWLGPDRIELPDRIRKRSDLSLPLARLRATFDLKEGELELPESDPEWNEDEALYFSILLKRRTLVRIVLSKVLAGIQDHMLDEPRSAWPWADAEPERALKSEDVSWDPLPEEHLQTKLWGDFFRHRESLFRELRHRDPRDRVESLQWEPALADKARRYSRAYRELLDGLRDAGNPDSLRWALKLDTLQLSIVYPGERRQSAAVILPWHPLRFLWYAAYAELMEHWRRILAGVPKRERRGRIDLAIVERMAPINLPMYLPGPAGGVHIFAQNLGAFVGVALPVSCEEPARVVSEVAAVLGLPTELGEFSDLPVDKLASGIREYLDLHDYVDTLRVSVGNPGDGSRVAGALAQLALGPTDASAPAARLPKLDILAHCKPPLPQALSGFDQLRQDLYLLAHLRGSSHLAPLFQLAIRDSAVLPLPPGGDVNLALLFDESQPQLQFEPPLPEQDSASSYGLLTRLCTAFESSESFARYVHQVLFPPASSRERHPVNPAYTTELVETHRSCLAAVSAVESPGSAEGTQLSLVVTLDYESRNRLDLVHHSSDWVFLIDRFLGVDLFDDPSDPYLASVARKYLLDYAPEFIEGLGHRLMITTAWREEVEDLLRTAMEDLGFAAVEESVGEALQHLKSVSGRLALRMIHDSSRAREAAALATAVAWMKAVGELSDSILIPVDPHPEVFSSASKTSEGAFSRCDLVQVQVSPKRLDVAFIEVKSRRGIRHLAELADRMCDQLEATEDRFRQLFFSPDLRLDHVLQRSRLAGLLRFYALRAWRHGFFREKEKFLEVLRLLAKLEGGIPNIRVTHRGYVVDLPGRPQPPLRHRRADIRVLTAADFEERTVFQGSAISARETPPPAEPDRPPVREAPPSPPKPAATPPPSETIAVSLGVSGDEEILWNASVVGSPHVFILGIPGQGKSWTVTRLLCEAAKQGLPALIIDFHGQFSSPESPYSKLVSPKLWDVTQGLPFSPFEASSSQEEGTSFWKTNSFAIAEIFQYVFSLGDIQRGLIYDAMRDCYEDVGFGSGGLEGLPTMTELERKIRLHEEKRGVKNVLVRCKTIFDFQLFHDSSLGGRQDLLLQSAGGLVVDLHHQQLEQLQMAAAAFLLRKVYKDMFRWGQTTRPRLAIVLDEAHRISHDTTLPRIMKEGRKFGVVVIAASQGMTDFHPDVLGNAGTKIIFRTNYPASRKVAGFVRQERGKDMAQTVEQLAVGTAMLQTPELHKAVRVRMFPPETV